MPVWRAAADELSQIGGPGLQRAGAVGARYPEDKVVPTLGEYFDVDVVLPHGESSTSWRRHRSPPEVKCAFEHVHVGIKFVTGAAVAVAAGEEDRPTA